MSILEEIVAVKKKTVEESKKKFSLDLLIRQSEEAGPSPSFIKSINVPGQLSIIAEMKKMSPSAGTLVADYSPEELAKIYQSAGAKGLSVLTEEHYFEGSPEHVKLAQKSSSVPILRKDFILDPYQVYESKLIGASAVLLIVAILDKKVFSQLKKLCEKLKMDVLVEVHDESQMESALSEGSSLIGINNRNLKDLSIELQTTFQLIKKVPKNTCVVSESGIQSPEVIRDLKAAGVRAALIGESILKSGQMSKTLRNLVLAGQS